MKTAISLPDELFRRAERASIDRKISRSSLVARALEAYLRDELEEDPVTASWSAMADSHDAKLDPALRAQQDATLRRIEW